MRTLFSIFAFIACFVALQAMDITPFLQYTGRYSFPSNDIANEIDVIYENDTLRIISPMGKINLVQIEGDKFSIPQYGGWLEFLRDSIQTVTGVKVFVPMAELDMEGKKMIDNSPASSPVVNY